MTEAIDAPYRKLESRLEVGPYDAIYVSPRHWEAPLSCAGRMVLESLRGLRSLVVTVFGEVEGAPLGGDQLALGVKGPTLLDDAEGAAEDLKGEAEALVADVAPRLEDVFRRARPRYLFFPLGVGGYLDSRIAHQAAMQTFHTGGGRDVYLYEERPEALVSGSVRIRLGQLGARLPPAASRVRGEAGLFGFMLRLQTVPRLRDGGPGLRRRVRHLRRGARQYFSARAWRPTKALGPRLQPLMTVAEAAVVEQVRCIVRGASQSLGPKGTERLLALCRDNARRLGAAGWAERYWLLLPERTGTSPSALDLETIDLVS